LLATSAACLSSEMDEKLIELVRKCEELYDMSNKKYRDADKSLARPGRKQATTTEDFDVHVSYL
jgi:hypothetical protein